MFSHKCGRFKEIMKFCLAEKSLGGRKVLYLAAEGSLAGPDQSSVWDSPGGATPATRTPRTPSLSHPAGTACQRRTARGPRKAKLLPSRKEI